MSNFSKSVRNLQTTLAGLLAAPLLYLAAVGWALPETKQEWAAFVGSVLIGWLGITAKDGATGSAPK